MKKTKHSEEKIIGAVKQLEAGRPVKEVARELGVTDQTLYNWKAKFGGMEVSDAKRLRALQETGPTHHRRTMPRRCESCIAPAPAKPRSPAACRSVAPLFAGFWDDASQTGAKMVGCCCNPIRCSGRAIENTRMIRFAYHGKDRIAEPHDHGILKGSVQLLSWQVAGRSSRPLPNWLLTKVDEITDLALLEQTFPGGRRLQPVNTSNGTCSSSESNQPRANSMSFQNEGQINSRSPISHRNSPGLSAFARRFTPLDSPTQVCRKLTILSGFVAALAAHRFTVEFDAVSRSRMESAIVGSPICACQDATGSWLVSSTESAW